MRRDRPISTHRGLGGDISYPTFANLVRDSCHGRISLTQSLDTKLETRRIFPGRVGAWTAPKVPVIVGYAKTVTAAVAQVAAHTLDAGRIITRAIHSVIFCGSIWIIAGCAASEDSIRAHNEESEKIHYME